MKTWPGGLLIGLLGGLPARFSSASGRGEFINATNHRRPGLPGSAVKVFGGWVVVVVGG